MDCPRCSDKSKVLDSRTQEDRSTRRKRKCMSCGFGYWTTERLSSDWEKLKMSQATQAKQLQTTPKIKQHAAARTRPKQIEKMSDEELENAIFEGELRFDEDEL